MTWLKASTSYPASASSTTTSTKPARRNPVVIRKCGRARHKPPSSYPQPPPDGKGVDRADDRAKDHAMPVVRHPSGGGGEVLRVRLQGFQDRKDQPLRKTGFRGPRQEGGNRHDRGVRNRRAKIPGAQRRPAVQVQRGGVVSGAL